MSSSFVVFFLLFSCVGVLCSIYFVALYLRGRSSLKVVVKKMSRSIGDEEKSFFLLRINSNDFIFSRDDEGVDFISKVVGPIEDSKKEVFVENLDEWKKQSLWGKAN